MALKVLRSVNLNLYALLCKVKLLVIEIYENLYIVNTTNAFMQINKKNNKNAL